MDKDYFYFKKFKLRNKNAALKINTDGVLLGAWADTSNDKTVLDVGTGSGIIALMLSQRFPKNLITAIDVDRKSYEEASFNFRLNEASNISALHVSFQQFSLNNKIVNHIISNPPFFQNSTLSSNQELQIAKHNEHLTFEDFWASSDKVMNQHSKLSVVLPIEESLLFCKIAKQYHFAAHRKLYVSSKVNTKPKRVLIEFRNDEICDNIENSIYLHETGQRNYSDAYKQLTKDFYLKF